MEKEMIIKNAIIENYKNKPISRIAKELNTSFYLVKKQLDELTREGLISNSCYLSSKKIKFDGKEISFFNAQGFAIEKPTKQTKEKAPFSNYDGEEKQKIRSLVVKRMKQSKVYDGKILTLSAGKCILEQKIANEVSKNFLFESHERDEDTYKEMLRTILDKNLKMDTSRQDLKEAIFDAKENKYAHLLMDFCSTLDSNKECIETALKNNIVGDNGIVMITLSPRTSKESPMVKQFADEFATKRTESAIRNFISQFPEYRILDLFTYCEKKTDKHPKGCPMIITIAQRVGKNRARALKAWETMRKNKGE